MEANIIRFLLLADVILALGVVLLYLAARGLPIVPEVWGAFWGALGQIVQPLRDLFNPDTYLAKALKKKGINPEIADLAAEWAADQLEDVLKKHIANES